MPARPAIPPPGSVGARISNAAVRANVILYRLTRGRLGNTVKGAPLLLLDHVGRKSGKRRTTPVLYMQDGEDLVIVASRSGSDAMPAWWLNLKAHPETTVQVGGDRRRVRLREATSEERQRLWARLVELFPDFEVYQSRTERQIPIGILSPA